MTNGVQQVAVIGARAVVEPFKAVGAKVFSADAHNLAQTFREVVTSGRYPLVFLAAEAAARLQNEVRAERRRGAVALSVLPSPGVADANAASFLKEMAERALGMDILK